MGLRVGALPLVARPASLRSTNPIGSADRAISWYALRKHNKDFPRYLRHSELISTARNRRSWSSGSTRASLANGVGHQSDKHEVGRFMTVDPCLDVSYNTLV